MNNQTNPACRDAFVEAMEARGIEIDPRVDSAGVFDDNETNDLFRGFLAAYQPSHDVDTESVLRKLKHAVSIGYTSSSAFTRGAAMECINFTDVIATIESLQREVEELRSDTDK